MTVLSTLWRRPYTLRSCTGQHLERGYAVRDYEEITVMLDVQFRGGGADPLPEGRRSGEKLLTIGDHVMRTADALTGRPADLLYYQGEWWECTDSQVRDKTLLSHCAATFSRAAESGEYGEPEEDAQAAYAEEYAEEGEWE